MLSGRKKGWQIEGAEVSKGGRKMGRQNVEASEFRGRQKEWAARLKNHIQT